MSKLAPILLALLATIVAVQCFPSDLSEDPYTKRAAKDSMPIVQSDPDSMAAAPVMDRRSSFGRIMGKVKRLENRVLTGLAHQNGGESKLRRLGSHGSLRGMLHRSRSFEREEPHHY